MVFKFYSVEVYRHSIKWTPVFISKSTPRYQSEK